MYRVFALHLEKVSKAVVKKTRNKFLSSCSLREEE